METDLTPVLTGLITRLGPTLRFLARSRMLVPALLFVSVHRPLAFVLGQTLWLCSPAEILVPAARLGDWAALLSHPQSGLLVEKLLEIHLPASNDSHGQ
ncbi:MAG: hypothetical protein KF753_15820 [Caldilineaceae bacterium]|nr:hypothetical protein [Caldilineaceae bacterium]